MKVDTRSILQMKVFSDQATRADFDF